MLIENKTQVTLLGAIDITPTNIGAPTISQFESATSQATDTEVTAMLDGVFS